VKSIFACYKTQMFYFQIINKEGIFAKLLAIISHKPFNQFFT